MLLLHADVQTWLNDLADYQGSGHKAVLFIEEGTSDLEHNCSERRKKSAEPISEKEAWVPRKWFR